ncbi:hypothetical protein J2S19_000369 [Metabacillus malikii]|uniref:Uncharacterized protein n=1 Tax=Metabacillus malikii TaxID=1504265 RepID=A0ABT9ZA50_9BACI|nr:hypothetical protein [Metabacillus malikii]
MNILLSTIIGLIKMGVQVNEMLQSLLLKVQQLLRVPSLA